MNCDVGVYLEFNAINCPRAIKNIILNKYADTIQRGEIFYGIPKPPEQHYWSFIQIIGIIYWEKKWQPANISYRTDTISHEFLHLLLSVA